MSIEFKLVKFISLNDKPTELSFLMSDRNEEEKEIVNLTFEHNHVYKLSKSLIRVLNKIGYQQRAIMDHFQFISVDAQNS